MRPRSIGCIVERRPRRQLARRRRGSRSISSLWMSTKKKFGARSAMCRSDLAAQIAVDERRASPAASARGRATARPTGVSAPGRWMLPTASRSGVERTRGARRASAVMPMATTAQEEEGAGRRADEDRGDAPVVGEADGERRRALRAASATRRRDRPAAAACRPATPGRGTAPSARTSRARPSGRARRRAR